MSTTKLNVRINHKYDTYENWKSSSLVLGKGEIAVCEIPTGYTQVEGEAPVVNPPAIGIKIGDGAKTFSQLNWIQATAGDVYAWAKEEHLKYADLDDEFLTALREEINGQVQDTNTTYKFAFSGTKLQVFEKEKAQATFPTEPTFQIDIDPSNKVNVVEGATKGHIVEFGENGQIQDSGKVIGDYLTKAEAEGESGYATKASVSALETAIGGTGGINEKLNTLISTDSGKSVRTIANEEIAAQLIASDAKDALDTLQEIADWIQDHPEDASAMNTQIIALNGAVGLDANGTATGSGLLKDVQDLKASVGIGSDGGLSDRVSALEADAHKHTDLAALNSITSAKVTAWDNAESNAKAYTDLETQRAQGVEGGLDTRLTEAEKDIKALEDEDFGGRIGSLEGVVSGVKATADTAVQTVKVNGVVATKTGTAVDITSVPVTILKNVSGDELIFECGNASGF